MPVEWCCCVLSQAGHIRHVSLSLFLSFFLSTAQCPDTSVHSGRSSLAASARQGAGGTRPPPRWAGTAAHLNRAAWRAASAARAESWT